MSGAESRVFERLRGGRAITWRTVLGLVLVPLVAAGVLLWGLWNPTERLDGMTAAVVNLDEPATVDGETVPMGRVLAAELIGEAELGESEDDNFTWQLTDEDDAASGLEDGRYATVVTIPEEFSSAATSVSRGADEAEAATIDIRTSDRGRLLDSALSNIVTATATRVLNEQLGAQYVGNVFVGMNELGAGIGEAAGGASQLATGGSALTSGADELADGTSQLADGASELATGTSGLSDGASQLAEGTSGLATGTSELADGASELADGTSELSGGVEKLAEGASGLSDGLSELASGAKTAAKGGSTLADGVETYTDGAGQAITGLQEGGAAAIEPLTQYRDAIDADLIPMPSPEAKSQAIAGLNQLIDGLAAAASTDPNTDLNRLKAAGAPLATGARESAKGQKTLADAVAQTSGGAAELSGGLDELAKNVPALAKGAEQLAAGTGELSEGAAELADGTGELATGAQELAGGTGEFALGARELAGGTGELADGVRQSADGARELADGLGEASDGIPSYTDSQAERLAETMVAPVSAEGADDELFNASGVPLFAGIALWAGALAAFLVLSPLWRRTGEAARGTGFLTLRSALPAIGLGAVQGLIAGAVLPPLLGYNLSQGFGFLGLAVVAGIAFALVNQGLSALLGGFGRFLSFVLLVVAFAIGVISTAPPVLQAIGDASPIGALFAGFQAVALGTGSAGGALAVLILWGLGGLLLTAFAIARDRRRWAAAAPA
ncbi:YhgE/Pip domain-containing protein [Leucobacter weissii]|uniref:YhgE/Pip domain-containing protein n=1 Tax=Leucobacter weissii TaxID=1983706 RepID=A0A939MLW4_9MICO|nr:YhgE/Pip domain-containing protein [Leucobacter weissii]MBO1902660.1 YhgE/Pip domain-containing protein [Leucobacter weissii]